MNEASVSPCAKRLAIIKAQLALRGLEVYELASGAFVATRWVLKEHSIDLKILKAFAKKIGATID